MKKYGLVLGMVLIMSVTGLTACGGKKNVCSVDGCSQPTYEDGLCRDHYAKNKSEKAVNDLKDAVSGLFN